MFSKTFFPLSLLIACVVAHKVTQLPSSSKFVHPKALHWDQCTQCLYFVDLFATPSLICRYDPRTNKFYTATVVGEARVSFIIPLKCEHSGEFAIGCSTGAKIISWDGTSNSAQVTRVGFNFISASNGMNAAKADCKGRFYGGTITPALCNYNYPANSTFFSYVKGKGIMPILSGIWASNGVAWDLQKKKMYFSESCGFVIRSYDWCSKTGVVYNERVVFDFRKYSEGEPLNFAVIGLTIDRAGILYAAMFDGSAIWVIDPCTSTLLKKIEMPTENVNDCAFGGPKLRTMYVSTGSKPLAIYDGLYAPANETINALGGYIFKIDGLNTKGYPGNPVRM